MYLELGTYLNCFQTNILHCITLHDVSCEQEVLNDLLITNGKDIITHGDANIDDDDAYTHITVAHVKNPVYKIKSGKSNCIDGILSDNFKKRTSSLYILITLLFSEM